MPLLHEAQRWTGSNHRGRAECNDVSHNDPLKPLEVIQGGVRACHGYMDHTACCVWNARVYGERDP